jgi:hypothetical protein
VVVDVAVVVIAVIAVMAAVDGCLVMLSFRCRRWDRKFISSVEGFKMSKSLPHRPSSKDLAVFIPETVCAVRVLVRYFGVRVLTLISQCS